MPSLCGVSPGVAVGGGGGGRGNPRFAFHLTTEFENCRHITRLGKVALSMPAEHCCHLVRTREVSEEEKSKGQHDTDQPMLQLVRLEGALAPRAAVMLWQQQSQALGRTGFAVENYFIWALFNVEPQV